MVVDGADGVPLQLAVVGPGVRCVEDAAVGGVVEEVHGRPVWFRIFAPDLVPEVYAEEIDPCVNLPVGEEVVRCHVETLSHRDVVIDVLREMNLGTTRPAGNLHRSRGRQAADGNGFNARFVVHHFNEDGASGGEEERRPSVRRMMFSGV